MKKNIENIDWNKVLSKKYPILSSYNDVDGINVYYDEIDRLHKKMKEEFSLSNEDAMVILKDMLYQKYKEDKKREDKTSLF